MPGKKFRIFLAAVLAAVIFAGNCFTASASMDTSWELSGIGQNLDLSWLESYIDTKEASWQAGQLAKMKAAGIPEDDIHFSQDETREGMEKKILCMMAVYRGYTFYNRVACAWYIDNLYSEMHTYRIVSSVTENNLISSAVNALNFLKALCPGVSPEFGVFEDSVKKQVSVTVVSGALKISDIYASDHFVTTIPVSWSGWTEEKTEECDELLSMDDDELEQTLITRQRESLSDSPAPLYKQGAAEWYKETFGGGTIASDACCPTAIATVLSGLKDQRITPVEIARRYDNDDYRDVNSGSYGGRMCEAAGTDYGIPHEAGAAALSSDEIMYALRNGAMIVMSMTPEGGTFASVYHYVALTGLTGSGQVIVNNPGANSDVTYNDISVIMNNQSGRGYGIFFPSEAIYLDYENTWHPAETEESVED